MANDGTNTNRTMVDADGDFNITIPDSIGNDVWILRWLYHRIVNVMAQNGHFDLIVQDVEDRLGSLSGELAWEAINNLVAEAYSQRKEPNPDGIPPDQVHVRFRGDGTVRLPDSVRNDHWMLRWLLHRVVSLMARHGQTTWLAQDVEQRLICLGGDFAKFTINDLIAEARLAKREERACD